MNDTKTAVFDGGPIDGEIRVVEKWRTVYECFTQPDSNGSKADDPIPPPVKHVYKEDPKVEGHFIYSQL